MTKREKKWSRLYLFLMIFFYGIFVPVSLVEWLAADGNFPFTAIIVGVAIPYIIEVNTCIIKNGKQMVNDNNALIMIFFVLVQLPFILCGHRISYFAKKRSFY